MQNIKLIPVAPKYVDAVSLVVGLAAFMGGRVNLTPGKLAARSLAKRYPDVAPRDVVIAGVLAGKFVSGDGRNVLTLAEAAAVIAKSKGNAAVSAENRLDFLSVLADARFEAFTADLEAAKAEAEAARLAALEAEAV